MGNSSPHSAAIFQFTYRFAWTIIPLPVKTMLGLRELASNTTGSRYLWAYDWLVKYDFYRVVEGYAVGVNWSRKVRKWKNFLSYLCVPFWPESYSKQRLKLTIRSSPFVHWLSAEFSWQSWLLEWPNPPKKFRTPPASGDMRYLRVLLFCRLSTFINSLAGWAAGPPFLRMPVSLK